MTIKTFEDLIKEVHEKGICQECGGCVSFCSSAKYDVLGFKDPYTPPEYIHKDKCLECGICYIICPQTHILDSELNKMFKFSNFDSMPIGYYEKIYSCQALDKDFLEKGTDGGVVNSILNFMLEKRLIDGAIVSKTYTPFSREASFAKSKSDLLQSSGAKLDISPQLDEIQKSSSYTHSIPLFNRYKFKKLAVVGTPCQFNTIRCMQDLGVTPSENIEICLGLFCYENFLFEKSKIKKFEKQFKFKFSDIKKINIKEDVIFKLIDDEIGEKTVHIPFNHLKKYMRPACNACNDFTNIYADISFGGLGSPDKYTTVITRTEKGKKLFSKVLDAGIIKCRDLDSNKKRDMIELISQFSHSKIKRKEEFMKNLE
ncbi:MAG: Coenzyme F420 hydrogenase/dehydrogenase, beta subunit C-terminal domain [Candidatus Lokiarchaeota archaeon]|nr:Coenzyme F420 hydrogenase/dehydrogenase, beta subunit C-terminal domain [Candidatus Lokiarchaeota archaeon]